MTISDATDRFEEDQLVARMAASTVLTLEGETVRLRDVWRDTPTVNGFLRHFGCLFCHQMMHDLVASIPDVIARGARVIIVGNGSVEQAKRFVAMKKLPASGIVVLTDPGRQSFRAAGFERGYAKTFLNGGSMGAYGRAKTEGHSINGLFGDLTQLGGVLVIMPPTKLAYIHRSRFAGDHPKMREVLTALPGSPSTERV